MLNGEIVDEVRAIREAHATRFGHDQHAICEDVKKSEAEPFAAGHPFPASTVCAPRAQPHIAVDSLRSPLNKEGILRPHRSAGHPHAVVCAVAFKPLMTQAPG